MPSRSKIATRSVYVAMVSTLLGCAGPLAMESFRFPPVCDAIVSGNLDMAMQLIKEGADPNAGHGCALVAAADRGQFQMVELLLDRGANANRIVSGDLEVIMGGTTPLVAAVASRDVRMVRLLLERGANPRNDIDAFSIVLNFGDVEMAELLLRHGADPNMTYPAGEKVYAFVRDPKVTRMVSVPRSDLAPDRIDDTARRLQCTLTGGRTLLHVATMRGQPGGDGRDRIAEMLIDRGADPSARTLDGSTPLMNAASRNSLPVILRLLDAGADASAKDRCGRTAADRARSFDIKALLTDK